MKNIQKLLSEISYAASRNIHGTKAMVKQGNKNAYDLAENYTSSYGSTVTAAEKKKRITAFGIKNQYYQKLN